MRFTRSILCGVAAVTLSVGAAFAGEDSSHRWHGTGPGYYDAGGLRSFDQSRAEGSIPSDSSYFSSSYSFAGTQNPDMRAPVGM